MKEEEKKFLKTIQLSLKAGVFVSFLLFIAGYTLKVFYHNDFRLFDYGIIVLIFTPVLRVIMLGIGFYRIKENIFALCSFVVLALMLMSVLI